jgi:hypothetical protein
MRYQIYCDRDDGLGFVLDGCWGSEYSVFDSQSDAEQAASELHQIYPDCTWAVLNDAQEEVFRIPATITGE